MIFWTNFIAFIQAITMPLSLIFITTVVGIGLWFFKKKIAARALFATSFVLFFFFSYDFGMFFLVRPLENSVKTVNLSDYPQVRTVVVLGGGRQADNGRSASATLSTVTTVRLVEGIRVFNMTNAQNLIVTGKCRQYGSIAALMAQTAIDLGVDEHRIITIDNAINTRQEANYTAEFVRGDTVFLVSSAMHLKRAAKNFEKEGVYVIPVATDFHTYPNRSNNLSRYFPSAQRIDISRRAIHEYLGLFWEIFRK
jgi:uncharacterized SAM-binding protein YcdF (DUF218 family)